MADKQFTVTGGSSISSLKSDLLETVHTLAGEVHKQEIAGPFTYKLELVYDDGVIEDVQPEANKRDTKRSKKSDASDLRESGEEAPVK